MTTPALATAALVTLMLVVAPQDVYARAVIGANAWLDAVMLIWLWRTR